MKIRTRFAIAGVLTCALMLAGATVVIVRQSSLELRHNFDSDLIARFQASAPLIASTPNTERLIDSLSANSSEQGIRVIRNGAETRFGDMPTYPPAMADDKVVTVRSLNKSWRAYAQSIPVDSSISDQPVRVEMYAPTTKLDNRIANIRRRVLFVLGVSVIVAAIVTWFVGGLAAQPLRRLARSVRDYDTNKVQRVPDNQGVIEVDAVAGTINELVYKLNSEHDKTRVALQTAQEFSWTAVHELRTPLTSLRTDTDLMSDIDKLTVEDRARLLDSIDRQQDRINSTLTALHDLARGELQTRDNMAAVDVCEVVETVVESLRSLNRRARIDMVLPQNASFKGWAEGLEIAIRNLVTNAVKHARPNVDVHIRIIVEQDQQTITLIVEDDGAGIAKADRKRIFERFERGSTDHQGSGLGLALVRRQALLHGGDVRVEDSSLGGARFVMTLSVD